MACSAEHRTCLTSTDAAYENCINCLKRLLNGVQVSNEQRLSGVSYAACCAVHNERGDDCLRFLVDLGVHLDNYLLKRLVELNVSIETLMYVLKPALKNLNDRIGDHIDPTLKSIIAHTIMSRYQDHDHKLTIVRFLHEECKVPFTSESIQYAADPSVNKPLGMHSELYQYLKTNGAPKADVFRLLFHNGASLIEQLLRNDMCAVFDIKTVLRCIHKNLKGANLLDHTRLRCLLHTLAEQAEPCEDRCKLITYIQAHMKPVQEVRDTVEYCLLKTTRLPKDVIGMITMFL